MYQKYLLEILYKISDLKYTLYLGSVSKDNCAALVPTYTEQSIKVQKNLAIWHKNTTERLEIKTDEIRRKRDGFDGVIHFIPGLIKENYKFREMDEKIVKMIREQIRGQNPKKDTSDLYSKDVQLISKNGKIYYLPEGKAEE